jgi:adenylate kinase family enzyme
MNTPCPHGLGQRISVVGCSGSGKTTLARYLAQSLDFRHVEMDAIFHQPGWQPLPENQFLQRVEQALQGDGWVVEGNYSAARPMTLQYVDTVVWLDLPRHLVMRQVIARTVKRVMLRKTLWNGNRERWRNLFSLSPRSSIIAWSWSRYPLYRARYLSEMHDPAHVGIRYIRLTSREKIAALLSALAAHRSLTEAPA